MQNGEKLKILWGHEVESGATWQEEGKQQSGGRQRRGMRLYPFNIS